MALTPQLLREIGEALDGRWFVGHLTDRLRRSQGRTTLAQRTVERWLAEQSPIPDGVAPDLRAAIDVKIAELQALRRKL